MADNVVITSGTGVTIATDDDGTAQHQYVKIEFGGDGSFTKVTTATGLPVQITSLPAFAVGSIVSVSGLTSATVSISAGSIMSISGLTSASVTATNAGVFAVQVTSLPSFALGSIISVSGLTSASVTATNAGTFAVQVTSLPTFALGSIISISGLTSAIFSISNLPISVLATVTNAGTFAISSLPALGVGSIVSVNNLVSTLSTVTNAGIFLIQLGANANNWSVTSTYTSAQTNVVLKSESNSTTAYYITDVIFSNSATEGNLSLIESRPNAAIKVKMETLYFRPYGGAVINFRTPIVLDTNSALCMTSRSVTAHSVTVGGYIV